MNTKKLIALIILIIIVILAVFSVFYSINKKKDIEVVDPTETDLPISGDTENEGFTDDFVDNNTNQVLTPGEVVDSTGESVKKEEAVLRQITNVPTAASHISQITITVEEEVISEDGEVSTIEVEEIEYLTTFIEKKNGHISVDSDREDIQTKKLNQTIPQTERGLLTNNFALLQYLDQTKEIIQSFGGVFIEETYAETETNEEGEEVEVEKTRTVFENTVLPNNILSPTLSPSSESIAFLIRTSSGTNVVTSSTGNLESASVVHTTPLIDINLQWGSDDELYISSKADSRSEGFIKRLDNGVETTILSGVTGLTANVSPEGDLALISSSTSQLSIYNIAENRAINLGIYSLPEKCTWSKINTSVVYCAGQSTRVFADFPQDWYQGKVDFADTLWRIDLEESTVNEFYTFLGTESIFDATNLQLSPDEKRLLFTDRNDMTPWVLKLD